MHDHDRQPFADITDLARRGPGMDHDAAKAASERAGAQGEDSAALGRLPALAGWLAGWQGRDPPTIQRPALVIFASSHGVSAHGVSNFTGEVIRARLQALASGQADIARLCAAAGCGLKVLDLALDQPTPDISVMPAFGERDLAATIAFGMEALADRPDVLALGDIGAGNGVIAVAVVTALHGGDPSFWIGPVLGGDAALREARIGLVRRALETHRGHLGEPLEILRRLGGRELAAMTGAIIAARHQRVPVVLDGLSSLAAASLVARLVPGGADHCVAGSSSGDGPRRALLDRLNMQPLLDWGILTGIGIGAVSALGPLRIAAALGAPFPAEPPRAT